MIRDKIAKTYRFVSDHATKALGALGAAFLSATAWISPDEIMAAADRFLRSEHSVLKVGAFLFVLVVVRGYFTGRAFKKLKAEAAPPPGSPQ